MIAECLHSGLGNNWSYKMCKAGLKMSPPTNQRPFFYRPDTVAIVNYVILIIYALQHVTCAAVGRDESFDSLAKHDTTTLQRAVMSPVQMPRPHQQQQLAMLPRQAPDSSLTR